MPAWATTAWMNRERLLAAARKLKWPLRTWVTLVVVAALLGGIYWLAVYGDVRLTAPGQWPLAQWVLMGVNVVGFVVLYRLLRSWFDAQDELRDEVDQMRSQIDDLRVAVHEHEHEVEFTDGGTPDAQPETVNALPVARPPVPPSERPTTEFSAVRAAPVSEREIGTVERTLGGHTFRFKESSEVG